MGKSEFNLSSLEWRALHLPAYHVSLSESRKTRNSRLFMGWFFLSRLLLIFKFRRRRDSLLSISRCYLSQQRVEILTSDGGVC